MSRMIQVNYKTYVNKNDIVKVTYLETKDQPNVIVIGLRGEYSSQSYENTGETTFTYDPIFITEETIGRPIDKEAFAIFMKELNN